MPRIHPAAQTARLGEKRLRRLFHAMHHMLGKAIESQVDVDRMPRSLLLRIAEGVASVRDACANCDR